jgi:LPXTG-motif cell wall-anchored protein
VGGLDKPNLMKSLNQLYKESGSEMPFKEWVEQQKQQGVIDEVAPMEIIGLSKPKQVSTTNLVFIGVGIVLVAGALFYFTRKRE